MLLKLALRNITSKPARAVATVIAIAAAVAMIFAMLSFKPAVYEYMYSAETATSGGYEIRISTSSSSDRITATSGLLDEQGKPILEGIESVAASLKLFATVGDEYVQARGFANGGTASAAQDIQILQKIELEAGELDGMRGDDVVISRAAAKKFGVDVGDPITLKLGERSKTVYVKAIAKESGYFLADAPYLVLGFSRGLSELIFSGAELCNEIYVKASEGTDVDALIREIKALPAYSGLLVSRAGDGAAVEEQATSLTAPIVLAGAAVMLLSVCAIVLLFLMSEREKLALVGQMTVIGATRGQIAAVFVTEGLLLAAAGALLGAGLAVGVFVGILKLTLSASASFSVSVWRLLGAEAIGFAAALGSAMLPALRASFATPRENMLATDGRGAIAKAIPVLLAAASVTLLGLLLGLDGLSARAEGGLGIALLATLIATLAAILPMMIRGLGALLKRSRSAAFKTAGYRLARDKRPARSVAVLGVGMAISMLLFMAWSLTTSIFGAYVKDFEQMVITSNVKADVDVAEFESVEGVKSAVKLVWTQGRLSSPKLDRSVRILGSADVLELTQFAFVTDEATVRERLASEGDYAFVDEAFGRLYGIKEGDVLQLEIEGRSCPVTVGGVLSHRLFNGAYVVTSEGLLDRVFGMRADTVLVTVDGDVSRITDALSERFSAKNYYVIEALEAFRWDMRSVESVFDLIGTLAFTVAAFILAAAIANALVGRAGEDVSRRALLSAGMSKDMLLASEVAEYGVLAAVSYATAFLFALPMTAGLIAALSLFGLSFEFMFEAWAVAAAGVAMGLIYAMTPILFRFKRGYSLKK